MSNIQNEEELVDKVLLSLRDAAPPDGMESRIVSALAHRASAMPVTRRSVWKIVSLASSAVVAGVVCALLFTEHRKTPRVSVSPSPVLSLQTRNGLAALPTAAQRNLPKPSVERTRLKTVLPPPEDDSAAISYPAPPLPLTEQEKLLLQLAHEGNPVQLAMLDPLQREAQYADERAQVQIFFAPPPSQEITHEP